MEFLLRSGAAGEPGGRMSAAVHGRHASPPGGRRLRLLPRRRPAAPAVPEVPRGERPYPEAPAGAQITEMAGSLKPLPPPPAFTGASLAGLPDDTGTLAAIREAAVPEPVRTLQRVRDGLAGLDEPGALAFIRRAGLDGGWGEHWALGGEPAFLGLEQCGGRQVAEVRLGCMDDGSPLVFAGDVAGIDARIAVLMVARDRLAYGGGIGSTEIAEPPAEAAGDEQPAPRAPAAEPETAEDAPEPAPDGEASADIHAALYSRADELLGLAAEVAGCEGVQAAVSTLVQALNLHKSAVRGTFDPVMLFADLVPGQDGAFGEAVARLAAQVAGAQAGLIEVAAGHGGEDMAARVTGLGGGAL